MLKKFRKIMEYGRSCVWGSF